MIFETESGSTYEVDAANKRVRRLAGTTTATPRQGADGEWKSYSDISDITKGNNVLIVWEAAPENTIGIVARTTLTSPVVSIISKLN